MNQSQLIKYKEDSLLGFCDVILELSEGEIINKNWASRMKKLIKESVEELFIDISIDKLELKLNEHEE